MNGSASASTPFTPDQKLASSSRQTLRDDVIADSVDAAHWERVAQAIAPSSPSQGGSLWDGASRTLTLRLGSDAAIAKAKEKVSRLGLPFHVTYERVEYAAAELETLADRLLSRQKLWASASGIGGGFDPSLKRVILQVDLCDDHASTLVAAINKLNDPRVVLQVFTSDPQWRPESRSQELSS